MKGHNKGPSGVQHCCSEGGPSVSLALACCLRDDLLEDETSSEDGNRTSIFLIGEGESLKYWLMSKEVEGPRTLFSHSPTIRQVCEDILSAGSRHA